MNLHVGTLGGTRRLALLAGVLTFAILAALGLAARARATENIYWDNYRDEPATIGSAEITGSGGGLLNLGGLKFETTEGMAYDPVTNHLYVAVEAIEGTKAQEEGAIAVINLDGSGASFFNAPGLVAKNPEGIVVDPATRMMYWDNTNTEEPSIGWAKLDGSAAGTLNLTGAATKGFYRLALDPASGRLFWSARGEAGKPVISWANVDNSGGGILPAEIKEGPDGLATDPLTKRLFMITEGGGKATLSSVGFEGGAVETVPLTVAAHNPYGLALDPVAGTAYWGNYGLEEKQAEALGFSAFAGTPGGAISPTTTPANGAQDPVILRSPTGTGAPQITQSKAALSCSQGAWAPDYPGAFLYQGPVSYSYQWSLNGQAIPGATAATLTATTPGSYSCAVTGNNPSGSATQSAAAAATVTPASLSVALSSKKVQAKAGKTVTVKFTVANSGEVPAVPVTVCAAKLTKKAKKGLVAPKCASVPALAAGGSAVASLKVKTKKKAKGTYKFTTQVKGASVGSVTVSVKVIGAKKPKRKH